MKPDHAKPRTAPAPVGVPVAAIRRPLRAPRPVQVGTRRPARDMAF
ncbi:hypothetical protein ACUN22_16255 [Streptomyces anulatus]